MLFGVSHWPPPRYVENTYDETEGFNFVTKPVLQLPLKVTVDRKAFTAGKFLEFVQPAMEMFPLPSTAIALPVSSPLPPTRVENNKPEPAAFNLVINASGKPDPVVAAYRIVGSVGWLTRLLTIVLPKPVTVLVQLLPPFVVLKMPPLTTLA
jgi:hypothetical protein